MAKARNAERTAVGAAAAAGTAVDAAAADPAAGTAAGATAADAAAGTAAGAVAADATAVNDSVMEPPLVKPRASLVTGEDGRARCAWSAGDEDYRRYHDEEWGRPLRDDRALFEKLCLEGFQAGLSWLTILRRRPAFRAAFHDFDVERVAGMTDADVERLVNDATIIRHRGKILAAIGNARVTAALGTSLSELLWSFAPPATSHVRPASLAQIASVTPESTAMSTELRRRGYRFVGPTTMHALMQSSGMVDDHVSGCWRAGPEHPAA